MKFVSKSNNLRIVLKHGMPAEPITGRASVSGVYIKFENGMVNVEDEATVDLMMKHPGYDSDFICLEGVDPYKNQRKDSEPAHDITEIGPGGVIGKTNSGKPNVSLSAAQKDVVRDIAKKMAMEMAPSLAMEMLKEMAAKADNKKPESEKTETEKKEDVKPETPLEKARRVKAENIVKRKAEEAANK